MITDTIINSALLILAYVSLWYIIALILRRNDIIDIAWGLGYIVLGIYYILNGDVSERELIIFSLIFIWGIRLAIFVYSRNRGKSEDFRYLNWRNTWKFFYLRSYFQIFILQGTLLLFVITPLMIVESNPQPGINLLDITGVLVWIVGFFFESVGDYQMSRFKKNPSNKGRIMTDGLWRYTRHPNYFGEVVLWWGIFIISLSSPGWYIAILGPVTITFLLLFVSGIPMLEEKYKGNKEFEEYKKQTSSFFPLPQKRK